MKSSGELAWFFAINLPNLAFLCVNKPTDFMNEFNKYPGELSRVSVIQYPDYHYLENYRDISTLLEFDSDNSVFHVRNCTDVTLPTRNPNKSRSTIIADKFVNDSEIIEKVAGSMLGTSEETSQGNNQS